MKAVIAAAKLRGVKYGRPARDFWSRVEKGDGCWLWKGGLNSYGYGLLVRNATGLLAHRRAWEITNGAIPAGMCVCHTCDVRHCVRPDHLFLGTNADNVADMVAKGRQHHPVGEKNHNAKLTADQVREIRRRYGETGQRIAQARELGVSVDLVNQIIARKSWRHV